MNEIFNTLRDKFPFLSLIRKGDLEYVGIVQNEDTNVISFYDYGRLYSPQDKMKFLKFGETWWHESNRKIPINIFLNIAKYRQITCQSSMPAATATLRPKST